MAFMLRRTAHLAAPSWRRVRPGRVPRAPAVPPAIVRPPYARGEAIPDVPRGTMPAVLPAATQDAMREAGALASATLDRAAELVAPGVTTDVLDRELHAFIVSHGACGSVRSGRASNAWLTDFRRFCVKCGRLCDIWRYGGVLGTKQGACGELRCADAR